MRSALLAVVLSGFAAWAEEGDPDRLEDRVFFSVSGGVSQANLRSFTDVSGVEHRWLVAPYGWRAAWAVGLWPAEWIGLELSTSVMSLGVGSLSTPTGPTETSGFGLQVVPSVRLALPLRYFAPYVGAGFAVFYPFVTETRDGVAWRGHTGAQFAPRFFAGTNLYFSRDLRFFLDVELFALDATAMLRAEGDQQATQQYRGALVPSLSLGVAWTPEAYRQSSGKGLWILGGVIPALLVGVLGALVITEVVP